jgi:hypothetical protein
VYWTMRDRTPFICSAHLARTFAWYMSRTSDSCLAESGTGPSIGMRGVDGGATPASLDAI